MKAPFAPGGVVVCVKGHRNIISPGNNYIVKYSGGRGSRMPTGHIATESWVSLFGVTDDNNDGRSHCWAQDRFRLYEPPKPEVKTTEKAKEKVE